MSAKYAEAIIRELKPEKRYLIFINRAAVDDRDWTYIEDEFTKDKYKGLIVITDKRPSEIVEITDRFTGQEWYDLFEADLNTHAMDVFDKSTQAIVDANEDGIGREVAAQRVVINAARRVSGLKELGE